MAGVHSVIMCGASSQTPALRGSVQVSTQASGTTFSPTIPTHQAGDVILVFVCAVIPGSGSGTSTPLTASGWTRAAHTEETASGADAMALFTLTATGSSHTITVSTPDNGHSTAQVYVLQYSDGSVEAASTLSGDPPSLTTSWGGGFNLWLSAVNGVLSTPSGFTLAAGTANSGADLATATSADNSATVDPGAWGGAASTSMSFTVAVKAL